MNVTIDTDARTLTRDGETLPLYGDAAFKIISDLWVKVGWNQKYMYSFSWFDVPIIQLPEDVLRYQEVVFRLKPDVIVETGIAHGGSAILSASLLKLIGKGRVIAIDIEIRPHNRKRLEVHPLSSMITLIEASSTAPKTIASVKAAIKRGESTLVVLNSDHSYAHVMAELEAYAPLVTVGSYIVATDGVMRDLTDVPRGNKDWDTNNPTRAAIDFAKEHNNFVIEEPAWPLDKINASRKYHALAAGVVETNWIAAQPPRHCGWRGVLSIKAEIAAESCRFAGPRWALWSRCRRNTRGWLGSDMKAVILAGGMGTRISEESHLRPKPMIEIGGRPILWHIMKIYSHYGITEFVICLGYRGYMIKEYFANYFLHNADVTIDARTNEIKYHTAKSEPWRVTLVDTGEQTLTGGRLKRVVPYLTPGEAFCFTYGDGVTDLDIGRLTAFHKAHGRRATVTAVVPPGRYGALSIERDRVTRFIEKPAGDNTYINGGFFVLDPSVADLIDGDDTSWEGGPLEVLAEREELMAFRHTGFWQPMDTLRDRMQLEQHWTSGKAPWKVWA